VNPLRWTRQAGAGWAGPRHRLVAGETGLDRTVAPGQSREVPLDFVDTPPARLLWSSRARRAGMESRRRHRAAPAPEGRPPDRLRRDLGPRAADRLAHHRPLRARAPASGRAEWASGSRVQR